MRAPSQRATGIALRTLEIIALVCTKAGVSPPLLLRFTGGEALGRRPSAAASRSRAAGESGNAAARQLLVLSGEECRTLPAAAGAPRAAVAEPIMMAWRST